MKPHSLSLLLGATLLAAACSAQETAPSELDPTEAVRAAPAVAAPQAPAFVGVISSRVSRVIVAEFDGAVNRLPIRNGQSVKQGEIVAELDTQALQSELDQAKGQKAAARGQAARAGAAYANARRRASLEQRLIRTGAAAPEAFRNAMAEAGQYGADGAAAKGEMQRAEARIAELERLLAGAKVAAPLAGVISVVKVKEGELARKGQPIARVFDPNQLVVRFAVPRAHVGRLKVGTPVELVTTEGKRVVPATVRTKDDDHDPSIDYTVFEAVIDPNYRIDEIRVGDNGHVRIAGAVR
jgi:RND family efflux transporter MFP subunit